jgi:hypothetical protein
MEPLSTEGLRDLTNGIKDGVVRRLIQAVLDLDQVSRQVNPPEISEETREVLMDCNPPLPALLVSFRHQDAVVAAFDEDTHAYSPCDSPSSISTLSAIPDPQLRLSKSTTPTGVPWGTNRNFPSSIILLMRALSAPCISLEISKVRASGKDPSDPSIERSRSSVPI